MNHMWTPACTSFWDDLSGWPFDHRRRYDEYRTVSKRPHQLLETESDTGAVSLTASMMFKVATGRGYAHDAMRMTSSRQTLLSFSLGVRGGCIAFFRTGRVS